MTKIALCDIIYTYKGTQILIYISIEFGFEIIKLNLSKMIQWEGLLVTKSKTHDLKLDYTVYQMQ